MRKGSDVIGKPVVSYDTGDRFARVKDVIFDQNTDQVVAFLIEESGF
ncbi:MAG: hypothetical protein HC866_04760 [Leptolyngbyaceae cyanobacterium RU_5_1]|nr:hypothetical protein [Leptolyngbyaceae cyanobacterium RU_5_1]